MQKIKLVLLITLAAFLFWYGFRQVYGIYILYFGYEKTNGKILKSWVEQVQQQTEDGEGFETAYLPVITYEYLVNGRRYIGYRYHAVDRGFEKSRAEQILQTYPPDKKVTVFYNKQNIEKSVLARQIPPYIWEQIIGSFIGGIVLLLHLIQSFRANGGSKSTPAT